MYLCKFSPAELASFPQSAPIGTQACEIYQNQDPLMLIGCSVCSLFRGLALLLLMDLAVPDRPEHAARAHLLATPRCRWQQL